MRSSLASTAVVLFCTFVFESGCQPRFAEEQSFDDVTSALANPPTPLHRGRRWLGFSESCAPVGTWAAERQLFFDSSGPALNACLYHWPPALPDPTDDDISDLFHRSGATGLTEDLPVVVADLNQDLPWHTMWTQEELDFYTGLRESLREQVGTAVLLPFLPDRPLVRIVVIDTAPKAKHGEIVKGMGSRHGDTLAHLMEEIVCLPAWTGPQPPVPPPVWLSRCAAEVTSQLALKWKDGQTAGQEGGYVGTLLDLANAIQWATLRWQQDLLSSPESTPRHLILNLSVSWEHFEGLADCSTGPDTGQPLPSQLVQTALQYAASKGVLIIAASGNHPGGPPPPTKLSCPGNYHEIQQKTKPSNPLLVAVSPVDYADRPLATVRPEGTTPIVGLGLGGVAWRSDEPAPPMLSGSSVSTAVVSSVAALVWTHRPDWDAEQVRGALYAGGVDLRVAAKSCPQEFFSSGCYMHRVSVCGALRQAGASVSCVPPPPKTSGSPGLSAQVDALVTSKSGLMLRSSSEKPLGEVPGIVAVTAQYSPWTFPAPGSATCPTCVVRDVDPSLLDPPAPDPPRPALLLIPKLGRTLEQPTLVVTFLQGGPFAVSLGKRLDEGGAYLFGYPPGFPRTSRIVAATLSGFDGSFSVTDQVFVHREP